MAAPSLTPPFEVDELLALLAYDEHSKPFIAEMKYRGVWAVARSFGPSIACLIEEALGEELRSATLTWAPTTPVRARERGFDQAELLALEAGRHLDCPVRRLLRRRPGEAQTGRSRVERSQGVTFEPWRRCSGVVVVVDDVVTTGATFAAAASAVRDGGADAVIAIALAATPSLP